FRSEPGALLRMRPPLILHWNFNHFVVLEGFGRGKVYLNDPAVGRIVVGERELDESFTGVGLTLEAGPGFRRGGRKPNLAAALLDRLRDDWGAVAFIVAAGLALTVCSLAAPTYLGFFVDQVLLAVHPPWLVPLLGTMALTAALLGAFTWLQQRVLFRLESRLASVDASRLLGHVLRLPVEFFTQRFPGDISSRLTSSTRVAEVLSRDLAANVLSAGLVVLFALVLLKLDPLLAAIGVAGALLDVVALRYFSRRRSDGNRLLRQESGKLHGAIASGLEGIESVKATGAEGDLFVRWAGYQAKVFNIRLQLERLTALLSLVPPTTHAVVTALVLGVGSLRVLSGRMTVGELVSFQLLMAAFLAPVGRLVGLGARLQMVEGEMHRVDDILRYPAQEGLSELAPAAARGAAAKLRGRVVLRDVVFGYDRSEAPLLHGFSLDLEPGRRIALVGPSGSGKSTIARLVMGLYEPWEGEVTFDGMAREDISRPFLNASIGYVDQSIVLFEGSVRDNLTLWDDSIPLAAVVAAARDAVIHDEIVARQAGYDAFVEEGGRNWSGGQRQRLEIARALIGAPTVLVLDEATSALDPETERRVDDNLRRRGCSCLIVAHRLSTIRDSDEIIVLQRGTVVQRGSHEELLNLGGAYKELITSD
ncbi:MAG TPA: ATP-binding cassette domain-containing protein, partial [Thermoanaerobaculia bacterium]